MEQLADNGNGSYAYVDDLDEAQKLFGEDLTSAPQVIPHDATPALSSVRSAMLEGRIATVQLRSWSNRLTGCRRSCGMIRK